MPDAGAAAYSRRADDTDSRDHRTRKKPTGSTPKAGSCQTAKDDGGKPGVRFAARGEFRVAGTENMC